MTRRTASLSFSTERASVSLGDRGLSSFLFGGVEHGLCEGAEVIEVVVADPEDHSPVDGLVRVDGHVAEPDGRPHPVGEFGGRTPASPSAVNAPAIVSGAGTSRSATRWAARSTLTCTARVRFSDRISCRVASSLRSSQLQYAGGLLWALSRDRLRLDRPPRVDDEARLLGDLVPVVVRVVGDDDGAVGQAKGSFKHRW